MSDSLGKVQYGFWKVSDCQLVSNDLGKVSNSLGKVSDCLGKVSDSLVKVSDDLGKVSMVWRQTCNLSQTLHG